MLLEAMLDDTEMLHEDVGSFSCRCCSKPCLIINSVVSILHASLQIVRHSCFCISLRSLISVAVGISYLGLKSWDFFSEIDLGREEGAGLEGII
ncbi:hypothetical protein MRB53_016530 [Persea americana]|uniref:Uncharacterized protein n=1 Tax=Persea americana TaxID=3435 RepID=A0ACC2M234_PERAE|nr:hypothetical protein MRB53_016530 [Persea americana]